MATAAPSGTATITIPKIIKKMAKSTSIIGARGIRGKNTIKSTPPSRIQIGAVNSIKIKIYGASNNMSIPNRKSIAKPPTNNISNTTSATAAAAPTTKNRTPTTVADTAMPAISIKSIVLGMKFQTNHVGHVKIDIGRKNKFAMASKGKGIR